MPTDKLEVGNLFIVDQNTGERTELKDVTNITVTTDNESEIEPIRPYTGEISFTMNVEVSDEFKEMFLPKKLTAKGNLEDVAKEIFWGLPLESEILDLEFSQNRIHKRKRINKKWAKRYGYTCTVIYI